MTTYELTTTSPVDNAGAHSAVWRVGAVAGIGAAAANLALVAAARSAGVPLEIGGEQIPPLGFAQLTLFGAVLGIALAAAMARRARRPRRVFVTSATALTVVSLVPPVLVEATTATRLVLELTHVVAALIIVAAIGSRLRQ